MVAKTDNLDRTVDDTTAAVNTLMLLSRVGRSGEEEEGGGGEKRIFRCKTCMKGFKSFQALGGHRASHTKSSIRKSQTTTSHLCPICFLEFPMGQALGGHMRKHRNEKEALVTRSFLPEEVTTSGKSVACLDSGLDSTETHLNLNLELGLSTS